MIPMQRVIERLDEYYAKNDTQGALKHLLYWYEEARTEKDDRAALSIDNELLGLYRKAGNREKAFETVRETLNLTEKLKIDNTVSGATFLLNIATVFTAFNETKKGIEYYEKALCIYSENKNTEDERMGTLYNNLSMAYCADGQFQKALDFAEKALDMLKSVADAEPEQAITLLNICTIRESLAGMENAYEQIEENLQRAMELFNRKEVARNGNYAFVCTKCTPVFEYYGYFAFAEELKERAKRIYEGT